MNEEIFLEMMKKYHDFKNYLIDHINYTFLSYGIEECYFIDELWIYELENCFKKYNNIGYFSIPERFPIFINSISSYISYIKKKQNFSLISKKVINILYKYSNKEELKNQNKVKYYAGFGKLIIEFNNNGGSLLIMNPLDEITDKNIFIIVSTVTYKRYLIYEDIMKINNLHGKKILNNNTIVYSVEEFINKNKSLTHTNCKKDKKEIFKQNLLTIFIYIYYYEKELVKNDNKEKIFNNDKKYFLINPKWMEYFKTIYHYTKFSNLIKILYKNDERNYYNLNQSIDSVINTCLQNNPLNFELSELPKDLKDKRFFYPIILGNNYVLYFNNCYIVPLNIMNILKKIGLIPSEEYYKEILAKDNKIFLFHEEGMEIGNINNEAIFIQKYILCYKNSIIFENEKKYLLYSLFSNMHNYLRHIHCSEENINNVQKITRNNDIIGKLIILKNNNDEIMKKKRAKTTEKEKKLIYDKKNRTNDDNINYANTENNKTFHTKIKNVKNGKIYKYQKKLHLNNSPEINNLNKNSNSNEINLRNDENNNIEENEIFKMNLPNKIDNKYHNSENDELNKKCLIQKLENDNKELKDKIKKNQELLRSLQNKIDLNKIKEQNIKNKAQENKNKEEELIQNKIKEMEFKENQINEKILLLKNEENILNQEKEKINQNYKIIEKNKEENKQLNIVSEKLNKKNEELAQKINDIQKLYDDLINNIEPISLYESPTLIGLNNIGATCFMNATLQCLSQSKTLSNYFLHEKNKNRIINNNYKLKDPNQLQLSPYYLELIENLWDENRKTPYSPNNFRKTVEQMNPLFKEGQPGDSKDFIIFILEQIHKELKKPINNNTVETPKEELNQYNKENAFNHFFNDFKNDWSIISDAFFGFNENTNICQNCKNNFNSQGKINPICYNYQIFNCLIFPLEEVKNMKNNFLGNMNMFFNQNQIQMSNNRVNIYDCFFYNQKDELFTGDNQNFCNICNQLSDSIYSSKIYISPNYLILILNRGKGNIYDVKLDFSETIDITNFVKQKDKPQIIYNLYGVITHLGQSGPNAHFVASCKSPVDKRWYRYNDAFVNPINDVQKDIIDYGTPYILFYQKQL